METKNQFYRNLKALGGLVILQSGGSMIDLETGMVYPLFESRELRSHMGTYLEDCCDEWLYSLDDKDREIVESAFQDIKMGVK